MSDKSGLCICVKVNIIRYFCINCNYVFYCVVKLYIDKVIVGVYLESFVVVNFFL